MSSIKEAENNSTRKIYSFIVTYIENIERKAGRKNIYIF
jgi:hypothetical protein